MTSANQVRLRALLLWLLVRCSWLFAPLNGAINGLVSNLLKPARFCIDEYRWLHSWRRITDCDYDLPPSIGILWNPRCATPAIYTLPIFVRKNPRFELVDAVRGIKRLTMLAESDCSPMIEGNKLSSFVCRLNRELFVKATLQRRFFAATYEHRHKQNNWE